MFCGACCTDASGQEIGADPNKAQPGFDMPLETAMDTPAPATREQEPEPEVKPEVAPVPIPAISEPEPDVTPAPKANAYTEVRTLVATINKGDRKLCVDINHYDGTSLLITKVNEGPITDWNKANPDKEIVCGDRITNVDGQAAATAKEILGQIRVAGPIFELTLQQSAEKICEITGGGTDGLCGVQAAIVDSMSLMVTEIPEGLVFGSEKLIKHDRIVAVNAVRTDSAKLEQELKTAKLPVSVVVKRVSFGPV